MRILLLAGLTLFGCNVEPPIRAGLDAGRFDGGTVVPDTGTPDSGPECTTSGGCETTEFCEEGVCKPRPVGCAATTDCAPGDLCARPFSSTTTITPGLCKGPDTLPRYCETDDHCEGNLICTAVGFCGPRAVAASASFFGTVDLLAACTDGSDCGPSGVCRGGSCQGCLDNTDCVGNLRCNFGVCEERAECSTDADCFPDNSCMSTACVRSSRCEVSGGDTRQSARVLLESYYEGLALCGARSEAWFSFDISGREGLRLVLTSTPSQATMQVQLEKEDGSALDDFTYLTMPGLTVVEIPPPGFERGDNGEMITNRLSLLIAISSADQSGTYDLALSRETPFCPGDALDIYGDTRSERALPIVGNDTYDLIACPEDLDLVLLEADADDQVIAQLDFDGSSTNLDHEIRDGATVIASGMETNTSSETVDTGRLAAGATLQLQTIAVDGVAPSGGQPYTLEVRQVLGERFRACRDVGELALVNGSITLPGTLVGASDLGRPSCGLFADSQRNDVLYQLPALSVDSVVRITVDHTVDTDGELTVALLSSCLEDDAALDCNAASLPRRSVQLERVVEASGDPLFIMISSDGIDEDVAFELSVRVEPLATPANNACAGAIDLPVSTTLEVSTYGAQNTVELTQIACGFFDGDGAGPDVFYEMTVPAGELTALELQGPLGSFLWVSSDCGQMSGSCVGGSARNIDVPVPKVRLSSSAQSRVYYVAVDGIDADDAAVRQLRVVRDAECLVDTDCTGGERCDDYQCGPIPANDICDGEVVTLDAQGRATLFGSTDAANHDYDLTCTDTLDEDVVYQVQLPVDYTSLTARILSANFDPALGIRRGRCSATLDEVCNDDVRFPEIFLPEVTYSQPGADTYYIIVDAFAGSGTFTLEIEARP